MYLQAKKSGFRGLGRLSRSRKKRACGGRPPSSDNQKSTALKEGDELEVKNKKRCERG